MRRRSLCNYANASNETNRSDAIYQRGQYWIKKNNDRQGDRRRYGVYINDSLIGLGGSLVRVKRFVNDMYKAYPFETDVNEGLTKVKTYARRAQMTLRTEMTPSKVEPKKATRKKKTATSSKNSQASQRKNSTGKKTAARPTMSTAQKNLAKSTIAAAETGEQVQDVIQFLKQHKQTVAVKKIVKDAERRRDALRAPKQGRLF